MTADSVQPRAAATNSRVILTFAYTELRTLWRTRTPFVFMFLLPAVLSLILGPAVSGIQHDGAAGRSAIGFAVMFSFMSVNYSGSAFYREFWNETWRRQAILRPPVLAYVVGKTLPIVGIGVVQLLVFSGIGFTLLDLPLHGSYLQLVIVAIALVVAGTSLGFLLFSITTDAHTFGSFNYLALIAFGALGGTIVASSKLPGLSRRLGQITPQYWAMRAIDDLSIGRASWGVTMSSVAVILAMSLAFILAGMAAFDYRKERFGTA